MTRVYIAPKFRGEDAGDGGIRRVVEAQVKWLPKYGIEVVDSIELADVVAFHAGAWETVPAGIPVVAHCHGLYWEGYEWANWALALNQDVIRTMHLADAVTSTSKWVAQAISRGSMIDSEVMYHGVDPDEWSVMGPFSSESPQNYVLWNKTRVDGVCNPAPVNELAKRALNIPFITTFGDRSPNVHITGRVSFGEAKRYVRGAGVYLATSRETFGIGTLEAMACGIPILGWNWGGQAEFIKHGVTGYLSEPGDYDDLYEGLRFCFTNREAMSAAARREVEENFTWEKRIQAYAELYTRLALAAVKRRAAPKVSVIITNYNLGKYLVDAISSVDRSTMRDVEIVVVDDASTEEESIELIDSLEDSDNGDIPLRVIRNKQNLYLAESLNRGIWAARGEYIVPLDADNMLDQHALKTLSEELDKDRTLDIAYGRMEVIREDGTRFVSSWPPKFANLNDQLAHHNQISSTAMYRRRVWDRIGGYRRRCRTAEDADFWCRALSYGFSGRRVTDASTLIYRDRSDSMSRTQSDWDWHRWYPWRDINAETRPWVSGGSRIPTHEFPRVSVIIPVGPGHHKLVYDALDSLAAQSFRYWEAIVINDTGHPFEWIHPWAKVITVADGKHGASAARNAGMDAAKAPFALFLDADDYLHTDALKIMFEVIEHEGGFVYADFFKPEEDNAVYNMPEFDCNAVLTKLPYPVTCMYNLRELREGGARFDETYQIGWEDWDFALQVIARIGMCGTHIPIPLWHYRIATGTLREQAYAARDTLKPIIEERWSDYRTGKVPNMGCGCGGRRSTNVYAAAMAPNTQADASEGETIEVEYIGELNGSRRTFIGRVTGNRYRFGDDHPVRRVFASDVDGLMALGVFKKYIGTVSVNAQPLLAVGPPRRD